MPTGLTYRKIAELSRYRVGAGIQERLRFQTFVNDALQKVADKIPLDPNRRASLMTDRASITATLTSGIADLTSIVTGAPFVNLNRIRYGNIFYGTETVPMEWLPDGSINLLSDSLDSDFKAFWIEGYKLRTTDATLSATLKLSVPFVPTLVTLPQDLVSALVDEVVAIAKTAQGSGWITDNEESRFETPAVAE